MTIPLVNQAHNTIENYLSEGDIAVDATMGNGFDTLFLAHRVGEGGKVYAFDLQSPPLLTTQKRLNDERLLHRVRLIQDNHNQLSTYLTEDSVSSIRCAMFNLGYLPGSDKTIQTEPASTIKALDAVTSLLEKPGIISVLAYTGHDGGRQEAETVKAWARKLPETAYRVTIQIPKLTKNSPPELILIEALVLKK